MISGIGFGINVVRKDTTLHQSVILRHYRLQQADSGTS